MARVLTDLYRGYYADVAAEGHLEEMLKRIRPAGDARLSGAALAAGNNAGAGTIGTVVQAGFVNGSITVHQTPARATIPNNLLFGVQRDWIDTCADAVAAAARLGERSVEVRLRQSLARALGESGDHRTAIAEYTTALDALEELGDVPGRANALNGLADVRLRAGAFAEAFDSASEALKLYEGLGDDAATAGTFRLLGRTCQALGDPAEARRHHGLAERLYARSGNAYGLAHVADSMADLESTTGRDDLAEAHLRRAVELHYRAENLNYAARSCRRLRDLLLTADPGHRSADLLSRAVAVLEDNRKAEPAPLIARIATP